MAKKKVAKSKPRNQATLTRRKTPADGGLLQRFLAILDPEDQRDIQTVAHDLALAPRSDDLEKGHVHREWSAGEALAAALTGEEGTRRLQRDALSMLSCEARVLEAALFISKSGRHRALCDDMDLLYFVKGMAGRAKAAAHMGEKHLHAQKLVAQAEQEQGGK